MEKTKLKCINLKVSFEFKYDSESPFGMDLKWENPSKSQIAKVRDFIVKQFNDEINKLEV